MQYTKSIDKVLCVKSQVTVQCCVCMYLALLATHACTSNLTNEKQLNLHQMKKRQQHPCTLQSNYLGCNCFYSRPAGLPPYSKHKWQFRPTKLITSPATIIELTKIVILISPRTSTFCACANNKKMAESALQVTFCLWAVFLLTCSLFFLSYSLGWGWKSSLDI